MNKDIVRNFEYALGIAPAPYTATTTGSELDMTEALDVFAVFSLGTDATVDATNFFTFSFTECATSGGTFTAVPDAQFVPMDSWDKIWNASGEANVYHFASVVLSPGMRYLKAVATETAAADGEFGVAIFFTKRSQPSSA